MLQVHYATTPDDLVRLLPSVFWELLLPPVKREHYRGVEWKLQSFWVKRQPLVTHPDVFVPTGESTQVPLYRVADFLLTCCVRAGVRYPNYPRIEHTPPVWEVSETGQRLTTLGEVLCAQTHGAALNLGEAAARTGIDLAELLAGLEL